LRGDITLDFDTKDPFFTVTVGQTFNFDFWLAASDSALITHFSSIYNDLLIIKPSSVLLDG
jgi:hypothetical protein